MADFSSPVTARANEHRPDFIPQAHCCKCPREADITLYDVANTYTGMIERGVSSEFCKYDKAGNITDQVRPGYRVDKAHGFCSDCYTGQPSERGPVAPPHVAAAWRFVIDHWDRDTLDTNNPRCDEYLELCNRQVKLSGRIDAIPPICRLDHILGSAAA